MERSRLIGVLTGTIAQGADPWQYDQFLSVAQQTLDPVRAAQVRANVAQALNGLGLIPRQQ
jgi:hypothetical protein